MELGLRVEEKEGGLSEERKACRQPPVPSTRCQHPPYPVTQCVPKPHTPALHSPSWLERGNVKVDCFKAPSSGPLWREPPSGSSLASCGMGR